jgi:membrane-bound lytic murein transglycosylase A
MPAARPILAVLLLAATLAACERKPAEQPPPPEPPAAEPAADPALQLTRAAFIDLPGWSADDPAAALPALRRSCDRLLRRPNDASVGRDGRGGTVGDWQAPCAAVDAVDAGDPAAVRAVLERHFVPFATADGAGDREGLFTGYYEATLNGARTRHGPYQHPIHAKPDDLVRADLGRFQPELDNRRVLGRVADGRLVPYYTRAEIDDGALAGRAGQPLLWADDPVDVFFLHVQGSGTVRLADGGTQRVGFAASNGHPFTAIGRELIRSGALDGQSMSMQAIRDWLRANPDQADPLMRKNARYIFFREIDGPGPIGAQGVPLTAGRSLAVDPAFVPLGVPVFLATTHPSTGKPLHRLMVAQDTGSAIKGPIRGDFYWGTGDAALAHAGRMKHAGRTWLLLPRAVAERQVAGRG